MLKSFNDPMLYSKFIFYQVLFTTFENPNSTKFSNAKFFKKYLDRF